MDEVLAQLDALQAYQGEIWYAQANQSLRRELGLLMKKAEIEIKISKKLISDIDKYIENEEKEE
jgi:hypothetical protein